jgi:hypothetical protein
MAQNHLRMTTFLYCAKIRRGIIFASALVSELYSLVLVSVFFPIDLFEQTKNKHKLK